MSSATATSVFNQTDDDTELNKVGGMRIAITSGWKVLALRLSMVN
jgi:hypothetical protein